MASNPGDGPFDNLGGGGLIAKSCVILRDPMDYSPLGSSVHGISQTRILGQGGHFLLQGIFLTQGWNSSYLSHSQILYHNLGGYISELGFGKGKSAKNLRVMSLGYHSVLFCPGPSVAAHECINAYALAWGR